MAGISYALLLYSIAIVTATCFSMVLPTLYPLLQQVIFSVFLSFTYAYVSSLDMER